MPASKFKVPSQALLVALLALLSWPACSYRLEASDALVAASEEQASLEVATAEESAEEDVTAAELVAAANTVSAGGLQGGAVAQPAAELALLSNISQLPPGGNPAKWARKLLKDTTKANVKNDNLVGMILQVAKQIAEAFATVGLKKDGVTGKEPKWDLVRVDSIATSLKWSKGSAAKQIPQCLRGIHWMDQRCTARSEMPGVECSFLHSPAVVSEFTTSVLFWEPMSRCFMLRTEGAWTISKSTTGMSICGIPAVGPFCQSNRWKDPCAEGAFFQGVGYHMEKKPWGWDRESLGPHSGLPVAFHYPLVTVIDGNGQRTKFFHWFEKEATQTSCPDQLPCRINEWARQRKLGRCKGSKLRLPFFSG